ncbi:MAG: dihydroneopterin aldolase [Parahaliea sp.]
MDRVFITGLQLDTVIGVYDWERSIRQILILDIELAWNNRPAAASDDLHLALDYAAVTKRLQGFAATSQYQLIETFAEQVAALLIAEFAIPWLRLRVSKPGAVAAARTVGVEIERSAGYQSGN